MHLLRSASAATTEGAVATSSERLLNRYGRDLHCSSRPGVLVLYGLELCLSLMNSSGSSDQETSNKTTPSFYLATPECEKDCVVFGHVLLRPVHPAHWYQQQLIAGDLDVAVPGIDQ